MENWAGEMREAPEIPDEALEAPVSPGVMPVVE
jgi:hypothetical protein